MASSLEHFVNSVRNLSGEGCFKLFMNSFTHGYFKTHFLFMKLILGSWRELYDFLGKSPDVLMRNSEHLSTVLDTLDPQLHSLGVLAIYMVKFMILNQNAAQNQGIQVPEPEVLINQVSQFITVCNGEQIRCAPDSCKLVKFIQIDN
jgi:hypothetical protein